MRDCFADALAHGMRCAPIRCSAYWRRGG
jgi:hypothetical protein